jgi:alpha-tubulin suppressor-like RCC1 family protein
VLLLGAGCRPEAFLETIPSVSTTSGSGTSSGGSTSTSGGASSGSTSGASTSSGLVLEPGLLAAYGFHACALVDEGAQCWGEGGSGELGNGSDLSSDVPVKVLGLSSGVSALAAGSGFSCAVVNGGAWCWGDDVVGELGDGLGGGYPDSDTKSLVPVQVVGLTSGVTALAANDSFACAIVNGGVWCWGQVRSGAPDSGWLTTVPVQITGLASGVTAIGAGGAAACAVVNGGLQCWGDNSAGQLGNPDAGVKSDVPVPVVGLSSGVEGVALGESHACAIVNGGAWCWGSDWITGYGGALGNPDAGGSSAVPVPVVGLSSGVQGVSASDFSSCAVVNGGAWCWGDNSEGELGNPRADWHQAVPVPVAGLQSGVQAIASGFQFACASVNGGVQCWGLNVLGDLGSPDAGQESTVPVQVAPWAQ